MPGPVTFNRTYADHFFPLEPPQIKRGGGGGKGGRHMHVTMGDMNNRRHPAPPGYGQTDYRRSFFNNVMGLLGFVSPTRFVQTQNRTDDGGRAASAVPWDRRWFSHTFRPDWYHRLWTVYVPNEAIDIQRGIVPRVVDHQAKMSNPYPNLLTFYRRYPPYSNQTKVLGRG